MADPEKRRRPPVLTTDVILEVILGEERTEEGWSFALDEIADRANRNKPLGGSPWPPSEEERERMLRTIKDVVRARAPDPSGCRDGPYRFRIEESYFDGEPLLEFKKLTTLELFDRYMRLMNHIARHDLPPSSTPLQALAWIEYEHDLLSRMIEGRDLRSRLVEDRADRITPLPATRFDSGEGEDDQPKKRKKPKAKRSLTRQEETEYGKEPIGEQEETDQGKMKKKKRKKPEAKRISRRQEKTEHGKEPVGEQEETDQGKTKKKKQDG